MYSGAPFIKIHDAYAEAHIALHGAQVLSFKAAKGRETMYVSPTTKVDASAGKAVRGGVPVCYPQFSNFGSFPASHGFARILKWAPLEQTSSNSATLTLTAASARKQLGDIAAPGSIPPEVDFVASVTATIVTDKVAGQSRLKITLESVNTSTDAVMPITAALHTYFSVSSLRNVVLDGDYRRTATFLDTAQGRKECPNDNLSCIPSGAEVDRIYLGVGSDGTTSITDTDEGLRVQISNHGDMQDLVIWNPGSKKGFGDMPPGDYDKFVCVEACCIKPSKNLAPGEKFVGGQIIAIPSGAPLSHM